MKRDILRVKTAPDGERIGVAVSSEYERKLINGFANLEERNFEELINEISSTEYSLVNVEGLGDGDYPITSFEEISIMASIVPYGESAPDCPAKRCPMYN